MSQELLASQAGQFLAALAPAERSPTAIGGKLVEFLVPQLDEWVHALGGIDAVISVVLAAYDKYAAPIDLPGIPNIIEPAVDAAAKRLLSALIRAAHDRIHAKG